MATKKQLKSLIIPKKQLVNFKVTSKEMKLIQNNADKYAGGNYSAWLRHAAINYKPAKKDLINEKN